MTQLHPSIILLGIIIVLLQSYIKLLDKYKDLKHEHDYMSNHLLEIYKGLCRVRKAKTPISAPKRVKKASKPQAKKKAPVKPKSKVKAKTK